MAGIQLRDVWFSYKNASPVLKGVELRVEPGRIVGLLGRNGAGKTTAFRILAGLLRADQGEVELCEVNVIADGTEARRRTGFMPDTPLLYERLSAEENLNTFGVLWGVDAAEIAARSEKLLKAVGLWSVRSEWVQGYSTGMRQKLAFCAALLHNPEAIVIDEPFTNLDIDGALWGRNELRRRAEAGAAVLVSSHIPELIEAITDEVAVLNNGVVCEQVATSFARRNGGVLNYYKTVTATE